jgi:DNA polymerase I-like protein with 3'-5' exonuclease and polymerase domains
MENQRLGVKYIERVVIREPEKLGSTETLKLIKELEKRGIPWDVGKSEEDSNKLRQEVKWIEEAFGKTTPT